VPVHSGQASNEDFHDDFRREAGLAPQVEVCCREERDRLSDCVMTDDAGALSYLRERETPHSGHCGRFVFAHRLETVERQHGAEVAVQRGHQL
jgi:hypothetical protein